MKLSLFQCYTHQYNCICRRCSSYYQEFIKVNFDCVGKSIWADICAFKNPLHSTEYLEVSHEVSHFFLSVHSYNPQNNYCNWRLMKNHLLDLPTVQCGWLGFSFVHYANPDVALYIIVLDSHRAWTWQRGLFNKPLGLV